MSIAVLYCLNVTTLFCVTCMTRDYWSSVKPSYDLSNKVSKLFKECWKLHAKFCMVICHCVWTQWTRGIYVVRNNSLHPTDQSVYYYTASPRRRSYYRSLSCSPTFMFHNIVKSSSCCNHKHVMNIYCDKWKYIIHGWLSGWQVQWISSMPGASPTPSLSIFVILNNSDIGKDSV